MDRRIEIVQGDITTLDVDAIVNAANEALLPGGGVCGAIHRAAGPALAAACHDEAPCPTGEARVTMAFDLPQRHVIHAVGPVWSDGKRGEAELLAACYESALALADRYGVESIAFPCISTGIYGYPRRPAAEVAVATIRAWQAEHARPSRVVLCVFGDEDRRVMEAVLGSEA
ncbi:MAG: O-acetyl-ADP-ribose deacetylase [Planctomycetota bacterium]|nr:O-acetyl-ADP-ribose deacetylase [Planctomycetota bacterium]